MDEGLLTGALHIILYPIAQRLRKSLKSKSEKYYLLIYIYMYVWLYFYEFGWIVAMDTLIHTHRPRYLVSFDE